MACGREPGTVPKKRRHAFSGTAVRTASGPGGVRRRRLRHRVGKGVRSRNGQACPDLRRNYPDPADTGNRWDRARRGIISAHEATAPMGVPRHGGRVHPAVGGGRLARVGDYRGNDATAGIHMESRRYLFWVRNGRTVAAHGGTCSACPLHARLVSAACFGGRRCGAAGDPGRPSRISPAPAAAPPTRTLPPLRLRPPRHSRPLPRVRYDSDEKGRRRARGSAREHNAPDAGTREIYRIMGEEGRKGAGPIRLPGVHENTPAAGRPVYCGRDDAGGVAYAGTQSPSLIRSSVTCMLTRSPAHCDPPTSSSIFASSGCCIFGGFSLRQRTEDYVPCGKPASARVTLSRCRPRLTSHRPSN